MNIFAFSSAALGFFSLGLFLFIFLFRRATLHRLWALFNLTVSIWSFGLFFATSTQEYLKAMIWWRLAHIGGLFISVLFYHTVMILCQAKNRKLIVFGYIQALVFVFLALSGILVNRIGIVFSKFYYNIATPLYSFGLFFWFLFAILGFYELFSKEKWGGGIKQSKIRYLIFGFIIGFVGGATYFIPMYRISFFPIGNFTIPIYCSIVTYAILKYRLLDIRIVFTRASVFILVYSVILGIPFAMVFLYKQVFISLLGSEIWWYVPLGTVLLFATLGPFIYLYFDKKAEDRLLKEQRSYQNILRGASIGMIRIKDLNKLLNLIVHVVTKTVKIKHALIYLLDKESNRFILQASRGMVVGIDRFIEVDSCLVEKLNLEAKSLIAEEIIMRQRDEPQNQELRPLAEALGRFKAGLVIPSFVDNKLTGILILGDKVSGKLYSEDDLVVFSVLANQAALAIENAQFYNEIKRTQGQLFQAEKMATIGTMADGLSHQINNRFHALSLIAGDSLDVLKTFDTANCQEEVKSVFSEIRNGLEKIQRNVLQGGEVVKGLLKYSRPEDGGFEPIDFKDVLNGAIDMVQYKVKLKEIDLLQNIPADLLKIHGNLTQLQEVFFNMIDNAYDAIKERELFLKEEGFRGKIDISAMNIDGSIEITVSDNGMGVKDPDKKKLFTPFFTTKATAKKGTGLGLYVIEKIITSHQGKLRMESVYQTGTRFFVTLPVNQKS